MKVKKLEKDKDSIIALKSLADKFKDTPIILKEKHERAKAFWAEYDRLEKEGTLYKR
jgi:hypothetical protein